MTPSVSKFMSSPLNWLLNKMIEGSHPNQLNPWEVMAQKIAWNIINGTQKNIPLRLYGFINIWSGLLLIFHLFSLVTFTESVIIH